MTSEVASRVKALYSVMQSCESRLGGGEGVEGLYGSISKGGMEKVLRSLQEHTGLDSKSTLVDVGAGLGRYDPSFALPRAPTPTQTRPLLHALVDPGVRDAFGIELDSVKCDKAAAFVMQTLCELQRRGMLGDDVPYPGVRQAAIEEVGTLDPATHAYSFWEGVPATGKAAMGRLFAASSTLRAVAVVQRGVRTPPVQMMQAHGFGMLRLVSMFSVSMSGSGQSFKAYVFARTEPLGSPQPVPPKAICAAAAAPSTASPTALPRLRTRRTPRVTELLRERRARQATATPAAAEEHKAVTVAPTATQQHECAPPAEGDANENVPPRTAAQPHIAQTQQQQAAAVCPSTSPASSPSSPKPTAPTRRRAARQASLDTRASVDLQSPVTGEMRSARSLEGAADTASKVLSTTRVCKQVSPIKAPSGLKLTGRTQPNATRALRPTSNAGGATLAGSMRQRRRGKPAGKETAPVTRTSAIAETAK